MAKVSFGKPAGEESVAASPAIPVESKTIDIPSQETNAAELPSNSEQVQKQLSALTKTEVSKGGLVLGDHIPEFKDIILPRINLVQGVGNLKDTFPQGGIVFNQNTLLFVPPDIDAATGNVKRVATPPVSLTVLGFRPTRFVEKIAGGAKGMIVNTEDDVRKNGGTLDWKEWNLKKDSGMRLFQVLAEALVLIERPASVADDDTVFVYEVEGKKYALAIWALKGSAYTRAAKGVFFTARTLGCLRSGYPTYSYNVTTRLEPFGANKAWVPVCLTGKKNSPEFLAFVASVLQAPESDSSADAAE